MATATVNGRTTVKAGSVTLAHPVLAVTVNTSPRGGVFSLHDCASPDQAALHNCVWPINMSASDGKTFKSGLTIHTPNSDSTGSFTVVFS